MLDGLFSAQVRCGQLPLPQNVTLEENKGFQTEINDVVHSIL